MTAEIGATFVSHSISHLSSPTHTSPAPRDDRADGQTTLSLLRAFARSSLPPLREAERRNGARPRGSALRPSRSSRRARRLPALHRGDFLRSHRASWPGPEGLPLTLSEQHLRRRSSRPVQPLKADPSSGSGSDRASWDEGTSLACRRRLPGPPTERLRKTPSVNGDGEEYRLKKIVRQAYNTKCASDNCRNAGNKPSQSGHIPN